MSDSVDVDRYMEDTGLGQRGRLVFNVSLNVSDIGSEAGD
jgi:hypothetical protein